MLNNSIKKQIEDVYGHEIRYPKDCDALALDITLKTGCTISPSTMKRLFGFIKTDSKPNQYTLDTIAIYIGYKSWEELKPKSDTHQIQYARNLNFFGKRVKLIFLISLLSIFITFLLSRVDRNERKSVQHSEVLHVKPLIDLPEPRAGGRIVMVDSSIFYLGGSGYSLMAGNNWEYDTNLIKWISNPEMPTKRAEMATAEVSGKIYVFGGWLGNSFGMTDKAEVYDVQFKTWETLPNLPVKLTSARAVSIGKDIYITGATTGETNSYFFKYNVDDSTYESLPMYKQPSGNSCLLTDGKNIYLLGGQSYLRGQYTWHDHLFVFNVQAKKWTTKAQIPIPLANASAVLQNGKIYVIGGKSTYGTDNKGVKKTFLIYDIKRDQWDDSYSLPFNICDQQSIISNEKILTFGGNYFFPNPSKKCFSINL